MATIRQSQTWKMYKNLQRNYRKTFADFQRALDKEGIISSQHPAWAPYHKAKMKLDSFVLTHIAIRAVAKNLTVE